MPRTPANDSARVERALSASNRGRGGARQSGSSGTGRLVVGLLMLAPLLYMGTYRMGTGPSLGKLLNPAHGIWVSGGTRRPAGESELAMGGLTADVVVTYDDRGVPHIRAKNQPDLYQALGYVVARDRLFQLELQTRASTGTLSELVGPVAVGADREPRALGMPRAAERALGRLDTNSRAGVALRAFARGVNEYARLLADRDLPVEFKLLNTRPSVWKPVNSLHLLNNMSRTLAYSSEEMTNLRARMVVGRAAADALFPASSPIQEPILPVARSAPRYGWYRLPPPGNPDSAAVALASVFRSTSKQPAAQVAYGARHSRDDVVSGSNSWAVSPARAANARALIAGDQHLDLTLPSVWYEVHLTIPDSLDVYGVTIPGAPGVVVGFNRSVAWTLTNAGSDVTDYYAETVDDLISPRRYMLDSAWRDLEIREERYHGAGGELLAIDTVRYTHRGPMTRLDGSWISTRWTIELAGNEIEALVSAQHSTSAADWMSRMERFAVPALSMMIADTSGNISFRYTGAFPVRPDGGRGDLLRNGSTSRSDWLGYLKPAEFPGDLNPAQGYLAAANQQPADFYADPRYFGADWPAPWRALRINELLRERRSFSAEDMRRFQTDPRSARAAMFVPFLTAAGETARDVDGAAAAAALLKEWTLDYTIDDQRAILFEYVMTELTALLWDELDGDSTTTPAPRPTTVITAVLLRDPSSPWWDLRGTGQKEERDAVLAQSLARGYSKLVREHGEPSAGGWRWDKVRPANIDHLLRIPEFSARGIPVRGGPATINAFPGDGTHGASWRMVVELTPEIRAWGIYPGGQSGNPFSPSYRDRIPRWSAGELDELRFPRNTSELGVYAVATLTLRAR